MNTTTAQVVVAPVSTETKVEATNPVESVVEKLSPKFKALAEKEARAAKALQQASAKEEQLKRDQAAFDADRNYVLALRQGLKNDPMGTLKQLGFNENAYTDQQLNSGQLSAEYQIKLLQQQYEQDKQKQVQERENLRKAQEAQQQELISQKEQEFKDTIDSYIVEQKAKYPLIDQLEQGYLVYDTIDTFYQETDKVMSIEEATQKVEEYLEKQVDKLTSIEKIRSKFASPEQPDRNVSNKQKFSFSESTKKTKPTLNNTIVSKPLAKLDVPNKAPKTEKERLEAAKALVAKNKKIR